MIKSVWDRRSATGTVDVVLKEKFKATKTSIKDPSKANVNRQSFKMEASKDLFISLDKQAEEKELSSSETTQWLTARVEFLKERQRVSTNLKQKSRFKWAVKGDENSRFFHVIVNSKRRGNSIKGLLHNGVWTEDPNLVKQATFNHFKE